MEALKKNLYAKLVIKLSKLQLDIEEKPLVSAAKAAIDEVMLLAQKIIRPENPILTETEFVKVYKAICFTQDADKAKKIVGETHFNEFQSKKPFYIAKYKASFHKILTEVQKEMSES